MEWEPDGLSFKKSSRLPSLFGDEEIDKNLSALKTPEDEIVPTPEKPSPLVIIASQFPHISARIIQFWGRAVDINDYLSHVVVMDRSDRHGFEQDVLEALLCVWNMHRDYFDGDVRNESDAVACPWTEDTRLHKAFKKLDQEASFVRRNGLSGAEAALLDAHLLLHITKVTHAQPD